MHTLAQLKMGAGDTKENTHTKSIGHKNTHAQNTIDKQKEYGKKEGGLVQRRTKRNETLLLSPPPSPAHKR